MNQFSKYTIVIIHAALVGRLKTKAHKNYNNNSMNQQKINSAINLFRHKI